MRNSNRKKSVLLNATRFFVLALCFTMVFAFALTSETVSEIASAYDVTRQDKADDATLGYANPMKGDSGEMTGVNFGYPGNTPDTTTWSFTETYNTVVPSTANMQIYKRKAAP